MLSRNTGEGEEGEGEEEREEERNPRLEVLDERDEHGHAFSRADVFVSDARGRLRIRGRGGRECGCCLRGCMRGRRGWGRG